MPLKDTWRAKGSLAIFGTLFTFIMVITIYEVWRGRQYDRWRAYYQLQGDWKGTLTVPSNNEILMWEYRPNSQYTALTFGYTMTTNRYGFRGVDRDLSVKKQNTKRVAFLGDSATVGLFVQNDETFVSKFEYYANNQYRNGSVESLNCAIDGYHAVQLLELLKTKVLSLQPDSVVYVMHLNDFDFEFASAKKVLYFKRPNSFLWTDIRNAIWPIIFEYYEYSYGRNKDAVFRAIKEMSTLLQKKNIDFMIVLLPVFKMTEKDFNNYPHWKLHQAVGKFLSKEHIKGIDLLQSFKDEKRQPRFFAYDVWHLNATGHDYVAKKLLPVVLAHDN
ncbi:SGNH/GDSL hydrolase family protein [bacterium]|nr:SGNH/GDSL hydrolase family protein [bacterium]